MEQDSGAKPYSIFLQSEWTDVIALSIDLRKKLLMNDVDEEVVADFGARLSRLWIEVEVKLRGREDFKLKDDFYKLKEFCKDTSSTFIGKKEGNIPESNFRTLFELEIVLIEALDFLKITTW